MRRRDILPSITSPPDVGFVTGMSSGADGLRYAVTVILTERAVSNLECHYGSQLMNLGWQRQEVGSSDLIAWSTWNVPERQGWRGLLYVFAEPGTPRRCVYLQVAAHDLGALPAESLTRIQALRVGGIA